MKLPRSRRILRGADYGRVRREGKSFGGKFLVMGYLEDANLEEPIKLGLITTKKIGNAVARNGVRRKLRGIIQRVGDRIRPGHWIVLIARKGAPLATSDQLEREFKWMLHRTGLMTPRVDECGAENGE